MFRFLRVTNMATLRTFQVVCQPSPSAPNYISNVRVSVCVDMWKVLEQSGCQNSLYIINIEHAYL